MVLIVIDRFLHLLPAPIHQLACRIGYRLRKAFLQRRGGTVYGCSIIARNRAGHILLVRHSYGPNVWTFPGGGLRQGEDPKAAAAREFYEELGCALDDLHHLGEVKANFQGATNVVQLFTGLLDSGRLDSAEPLDNQPRPDGREIVAARFFAPDDLPSDCSPTVMRNGALYDAAIRDGLI